MLGRSIEQAHQPDEFLETRFIEPTRELLTQLVTHFAAKPRIILLSGQPVCPHSLIMTIFHVVCEKPSPAL